MSGAPPSTVTSVPAGCADRIAPLADAVKGTYAAPDAVKVPFTASALPSV
jgi:hypothetical protein